MRRRGSRNSSAVYLVTGGAGFIGSHLVETLAIANQRVRVLDNFSSGKRENLTGVEDQIDILEGDIRSAEDCRRACDGVDFVLHHGACVSVAESFEDPVLYEQTNALGTLNMLCAARDAGCRRFVYAGSASAYGNPPDLPHREDFVPQPLSPYAIAKYVGELYCRSFFDAHGLETVVLRYFNVFGPRQDSSSPYSGVIAKFIDGLLGGDGITIFGDGEQSRDFVPVENVVAANLLACTEPDAPGAVINIGCGEQLAVARLAKVLADLTGARSSITHESERPGDIRHSRADITRAKEILGYRVSVPVLDGLRRTVAWYRDSHSDGSESRGPQCPAA
ncbi:MAG: SDR family oxidoreductase [Armatimonadetes bacterium]|nr:SDR family oxidoreductase [Armatimonadota bacterium]